VEVYSAVFDDPECSENNVIAENEDIPDCYFYVQIIVLF